MDNKKIEIFQVMRGIAALGIVYFHTEYGPWRSANWGVDFLFILSGYLIMVSNESENRKGYWRKKLLKICPLYYAMTIVVAVIWMIEPAVFRSTLVTFETLVKSFLFIPCNANNGKIYPIYSVAWTLNAEMFFYAVYYAAMKISHKYRGILAGAFLCLCILIGLLFKPQSAVLRFWSQIRLIDFVVGIGLYQIKRMIGEIHIDRNISFAILTTGVALLFSGYYLVGKKYCFLWNLFWSSILVVVCWSLKDSIASKKFKLLGDMSYSVYMTHFLIIGAICRMLIDNTQINLFNTLVVATAVGISLVCSWIVYQVFEVKLFCWGMGKGNRGV